MSDHPYHSVGAQRDRVRTWSYLDRIANALEQMAGIGGEPTADDVVSYLRALRDEGCTYTEIGLPTNDRNLPVTVNHDGETCPVHETGA